MDQIQPEIEEVDRKDVISTADEPKSKDTPQMTSEEQKRFAKAELMAQKLLEEQQRQEEEKKRREEQRKLKKEKKLKQKQKKEEEKLKKKKKEEGKLEKEKQKELLNNILTGDTETPSSENTATSITTNLAPWANKKPEGAVYNQISSALEDLKKENSSKKEKKPNRTQLDREQALKLQKEILSSAQIPKTQTGSAWGIKPQQPIKVDIKGELMKDSTKINSQSKINKANNGDIKPDSTFIEEQKKLWEQVQKKTKKFNRASSLDDFISRTPSPSSSALNSSNTSNAWTTVSSKSTTHMASTMPVAGNQSKSYISLDTLRSSGGLPTATKTKMSDKSKQIGSSTSIPTLKARQVKPSRIPAYPGNASVSKRQEFLRWCRSQLKLNTGVQPDNVLEMLLSLPPGSESKEIIADTIYSYSSTMDGRRFATDFIKKRLECEEEINDPLSWSEVLAMPEGSSEDWEFQVVGKKKGKRF